MSAATVTLHVLAVLAAVIGTGWLLGRLLRVVGQPAVIGELAAGILLGPSVLGELAPELQHFLVPDSTADPHGSVPTALKAIAQLGVVLYMFLVGLELDLGGVARQVRAVAAVAGGSIAVPFVLGFGFAWFFYSEIAEPGVHRESFAVFVAVALSITAFPVLARILSDRKLERTPLGILALGSAAVADVAIWCVLAIVPGVARAEFSEAVWVVVGAFAFIATMLFVVRPAARWLLTGFESKEPAKGWLALPMFGVLLAGWTTEWIGIHAVFGAFLFGAVLPRNCPAVKRITPSIEGLVTVVLLPAFFAVTGLNTKVGLISGADQWLLCGGIIALATIGKIGGTFVAARLCGYPTRFAASLGILMNTRGLMEVIALNLGLSLGLVTPTLFAMMVLMAIVTTATTGPALQLLESVMKKNPSEN